MGSPDVSDDVGGLLNGEGHKRTLLPELHEPITLDADPLAEGFYPGLVSAQEAGDVRCCDAGHGPPEVVPRPLVHNAFWIAGKVPSLNDLLDAKSKNQPRASFLIMRQKPQKGKGAARYSLYNDIKQDWKRRTIRALGPSPVRVTSAYFGYVVVEETLKRDPSNICSSAVKFIEDGLVEAGVLPNDGWQNVLGIRLHWVHRKGREPGIYVVMSSGPLTESDLAVYYEAYVYGQNHSPKEH